MRCPCKVRTPRGHALVLLLATSAFSSLGSHHHSMIAPDAAPPTRQDVAGVLRTAFNASDGAVATIGDMLRVVRAVAPRGCAGADAQFFSTMALDEMNTSMHTMVVACSDALNASAASAAASSAGGKRAAERPLADRNSPAVTPRRTKYSRLRESDFVGDDTEALQAEETASVKHAVTLLFKEAVRLLLVGVDQLQPLARTSSPDLNLKPNPNL